MNSRPLFTEYSQFTSVRTVRVGGQRHLRAVGEGTVPLLVRGSDDQGHFLNLIHVLYVPGMHRNLLSVGKLTQEDWTVNANRHQMTISRGNITLPTYHENGLFFLKVRSAILKTAPMNASYRKTRTMKNKHATST